jgi:DNA gyrase/topoisomerase IV subunit A
MILYTNKNGISRLKTEKIKMIGRMHIRFPFHFHICLKRNGWNIHKYEFERINVEIGAEWNMVYLDRFHPNLVGYQEQIIAFLLESHVKTILRNLKTILGNFGPAHSIKACSILHCLQLEFEMIYEDE